MKPGRSGRELMVATRPFARESRPLSWWHLCSTFAVLGGSALVAAAAPWWPVRVIASVVMGLTMVRAFIQFHDLHHGAIFRGSPAATGILNLYGLLLLTPPRVWRETHNYHHAHTAKTEGPQRGTYTLLTTDQWRDTKPLDRVRYRVERHPLTVLCGYFTVFILSFGLIPFFRNPRRFWDSGLSVLLHGSITAALILFGGPATYFFAFLLPFVIAGASGAYLFYAQHNFEGMTVPSKREWNHTRASLEASSYLKLGPVMRWFTGNIGYHHVHHLNPRIPFYRLPAAMAGTPELQHPVVTTLSPRTIVSSFRLKLWDPERGRMVGYRAAASSA
ncbi:MAG: fatty acid desaturase family protein [Planctomycetota bacterium]|jgi:omega-6 fatty acid desaturase (delta-12 desaturase)